MMPITRRILGYQEIAKNPQKTLFGGFSKAARKPSKNPPADPENVEKPSKNPPRRLFLRFFEAFAGKNLYKGGARFARAPLCMGFGKQKHEKTLKKVSGEGFWRVFKGFLEGFRNSPGPPEGFWRVFGEFWKGFLAVLENALGEGFWRVFRLILINQL